MSTVSEKPGLSLGVVGLGRMGLNMARRLHENGIVCIGTDPRTEALEQLARVGAKKAAGLTELVGLLPPPRAVWLMLPTAIVDKVLYELVPLMSPGDMIIDGGNSHYVDDLRRAESLAEKGILYVDVGVSGGVWGRERGYCLMIGGPRQAYEHLQPAFAALAPGVEAAERTPGRQGTPTPAEHGYLYCGPNGAGHFVKMVHNGIEYGLMAAYAEGLNVLHEANIGNRNRSDDAETSPLEHPDRYRYDLPIGDVVEVWRRGSVIGSWLLDLTASEMLSDDTLDQYSGRVSDSGEGRWTAQAAIDEGVPVPVLTAALFGRFASRGRDVFADKVMSAMRHAFGGHAEKTATDTD